MKIKLNPNKEIVNEIKTKLKEKDGYCPCRPGKLPENKCPCEEFREQIISGECHCGLFIKEEEDNDKNN